jgi:type VI secretion system secreted protein VgrG
MAEQRKFSVKTPLPKDKLLIRAATVTERLGQPFEIDIDLLSPDESVDFDSLLGKDLTVSIDLDSGTRHFHAFIAGFTQLGRLGRYVTYRARAVPWLWFLTRTADCFIFQSKTAPDIIKEIFREHGFTDIKDSLTKTYRTREYCVQYRETDFNFVQRLMEEEGIYYYFQHTDSTHTLVLADSYSAHQAYAGYGTIEYFPYSDNAQRDVDHIHDWHLSRNIQPGKYVVTDYDFTKPRAALQTQFVQQRSVPKSDFEMYDYPGKYLTTAEGDHYAQARLEGFQSSYETVRGIGNARGLAVGSLFKLSGYPRSDQNREYLVVAATHRLDAGEYEAGTGADADDYSCSFEAMDAKQPFRGAATAFKTRVSGPQTAMVVGPAGEEIYTDKYARVKLKFHWDRDPNRDENSSCWVRVSQIWAGKGWGQVSIPRIGQEVIVDFLEGDPDQPLITGRVYNQDNMPPYGLPGAGVVSGLKSQTHKGSGFNEMSMDDTAGKEKVTIHAQYDMSTTVLHDKTSEIKNNRTAHVVVDDTLNVDANRTMAIKGKLTETIDSGQDVTVTAGYTETITGGSTHDITGAYDTSVTGAISQTSTATTDIHSTAPGTYTSDAKLTFGVGGASIEVTPVSVTITAPGSTVKVDPSGVSLNGLKISLNG